MTLRAASCILFALVFATNAFGQNLLWETIADLSGGTDIARAITLSKNAAVVIGNASNTQEEVNDFVVSALRRKDGTTTWTDRVPTDSNVLGLQIASARGRVFASGYAPPAAGFGSDIVVRGYDAVSGALLWSSVWDEGRDDLPQALAAGPSAAVVVGYGGNTPGQNVSFLVRAYRSGEWRVLWDDRVQRSANGTAAWQVAVTRNRVFVAGNVLESGANELIVRAYNAASGTLVWEMSRPATSPVALKAVGPRVLLAGSSSGAGYLGAFDAGSGALLWEDQATEPSSFRDLAVEGNRGVVVGSADGAVLVRSVRCDDRVDPVGRALHAGAGHLGICHDRGRERAVRLRRRCGRGRLRLFRDPGSRA